MQIGSTQEVRPINTDAKLMEMLTGYAAAHQHPFNIFVHIIGIPVIMLGALIPLTWVAVDIVGLQVTLAHAVVLAFFAFYLTLDAVFAIAFLIGGWLLALLAVNLGALPGETAWSNPWVIAALCFFGGYAAQFAGHAIEKSMPVLVKHPIQANLAAPFFTVVELFKVVGLRDDLFNAVQQRIAAERDA